VTEFVLPIPNPFIGIYPITGVPLLVVVPIFGGIALLLEFDVMPVLSGASTPDIDPLI